MTQVNALTRSTVYFPIQSFRNVSAENITLALNELIVDINNAFSTLGAGGVPFVTQRQMRSALQAGSNLQTVFNAIPAAIGDPVQIQWACGNVVVTGDGLYNAIQSALGFSAAQMLTLMAQASVLAP